MPETISEISYVTTRSVACDGDAKVLGHPRVFLNITGTQAVCPYCSKIFILKPGSPDHNH